jgi:hypothetical protein
MNRDQTVEHLRRVLEELFTAQAVDLERRMLGKPPEEREATLRAEAEAAEADATREALADVQWGSA